MLTTTTCGGSLTTDPELRSRAATGCGGQARTAGTTSWPGGPGGAVVQTSCLAERAADVTAPEVQQMPGTDPAEWSQCLEPTCRTQLLDGPRRCTPHAEADHARGHRFQREPPSPAATPLERMVYLATETPHHRCRHCAGRRSLHHDDGGSRPSDA